MTHKPEKCIFILISSFQLNTPLYSGDVCDCMGISGLQVPGVRG